MEAGPLPISALDVSYGDSLAPPGMRRIADSSGSGIDVNLAHGVPTFVWYRPLKTTAGGACGVGVVVALVGEAGSRLPARRVSICGEGAGRGLFGGAVSATAVYIGLSVWVLVASVPGAHAGLTGCPQNVPTSNLLHGKPSALPTAVVRQGSPSAHPHPSCPPEVLPHVQGALLLAKLFPPCVAFPLLSP
jgi:hypothetical protein